MATIRKCGDYLWGAQIRKKCFLPQNKFFNTKIEVDMVHSVLISRYLAEVTPLNWRKEARLGLGVKFMSKKFERTKPCMR